MAFNARADLLPTAVRLTHNRRVKAQAAANLAHSRGETTVASNIRI